MTDRYRRAVARRATPEEIAAASRGRGTAVLVYVGLAAVGAVAGTLVPLLVALLILPARAEIGLAGLLLLFLMVGAGAVGLLAGVLAGTWVNAARTGPDRTRRFGVAVWVLIVAAAAFTIYFALAWRTA